MANPALQFPIALGLRAGGLLVALSFGGLMSSVGCVSTAPSKFSAEVIEQAAIGSSVVVAAPPSLIPVNYTASARPDLAEVELARWWMAFQNDSLTEVMRVAIARDASLDQQGFTSHPLVGEGKVAGNAAAAFFDKVLSTRRMELAQQQIQVARKVLQAADARYRAGERGRADILLAKAEVERLQADLAEFHKEWTVSEQHIRRLIGFQTDPGSVVHSSDLRFTNPLLIDVGQPQQLLERRGDLLVARAQLLSLHQASDNFHTAFAETANHYQGLIDLAYAEVNAALQSVEPGVQQIAMLTRAESNQRQAWELMLDQYVSDRVAVAELISVQSRWFDVAHRLITAQHQHSKNVVLLYVAAGGGRTVEPPMSFAGRVHPKSHVARHVARQQLAHPEQFYSLGQPTLETPGMCAIHLLPPIERIDHLGNGTLTVISLGGPTPIPHVGQTPIPIYSLPSPLPLQPNENR